ncbi:MAG TPA: cytochrome c oxidase assembly protein [Candidatus Acidoferrales bacterium]|nr:cytochrome c oxidase assembly protein [Candidatus Acidoferrales bacterium]
MSARSMAALAAALVVAAAAFSPVFDRLADASFAWHMVQHLALLFAVPLLLLSARPFGLFAAAAGKRRTAAFVRATRPLHALGRAPVGLCALIAVLWVTHFSGLYEASLEHPLVHVAEHGLYLLAGTLFWLPVLAPPPLRPASFPERLFYLTIALPQGALLGAALDGARAPLYAHYAALASPAAALTDQHAAAAVMWIGGGLTIFAALLSTLGVWALRETRAEPAASLS